ncbi:MAG: hypothetical protein N2505_06890, partial [Endomicrobia bacterium]|nr:hypothetical protein [Endomicrobiia bacterium]
MNKLENLVSKIEKIHSLVKSDELSFLNAVVEKIEELKNKVNKCEIVIPLLGEFSSGKSSLINSLIGLKV